MKKVFLTILVFCASCIYAQNWVMDGNGIPERVAINEFIVLNNELYACGHFISPQFTSDARLYKTTDDGNTWNQVTMSGLGTKTMNAIFDFNGTLFTSGSLSPNGAEQKYGVYSSKDNGSSWSENGNGIPERVAINEFIVLNNELYACGHFISPQFMSEPKLYKFINGKWNQVSMSGLGIKTMNAIFDFNGTLFTSGSLSPNGAEQKYGVFFSKDNGNTWEKSGNGIPERVAVNEFITIDGELYACGHFITEQFTSQVRLYKSKDNGTNWEQVATPGLETLTGNAIFDYKGTLFVSGSIAQMGPKYSVYLRK